MTDKNVINALNDLLDIVSTLAKMVSDIDPGMVKDIDTLDYLVERADKAIKLVDGALPE